MTKLVVSISVTPIGTADTSVSKYVREVISILQKAGLKYRVGAGFTDVEIDSFETLAKLLSEFHTALTKMGVKRMSTLVKISYRADKEETIEAILHSAGFSA
jgi:uncharacterized protein (TIGR00106 family)